MEPLRRQIKVPQPGTAPRIRWRRIDLNDLPQASGVYAIKSNGRWLYIGRSQNIANRMKNPWHPARITLGLWSLPMTYHWHPHPHVGLHRLETALIRQHAPEWNGGTSFGVAWDQMGPACELPWQPPPEVLASVEAARGLLFAL